MSFPTSKKQTYDKKYGQVNITAIKNGKFHAYWRDTDVKGDPLKDKEGNLIDPVEINPSLKVDDCNPVCKIGKWCATLSGDRIYNLRPISGVFPGHFKEFISAKDSPPAPKLMGTQYPHLVFSPLFELDREDVKGMVVGYRYGLRYNFEEYVDDEGNHIVGYSVFDLSKSPATQQVDEFLKVTGIAGFGDVKYTDNALPIFQRRALEAKKSVLIHVEKGAIKALIPDQNPEDFGNETDEIGNGKEE